MGWFALALVLGCGESEEPAPEIQPEFPLGALRFVTPPGFPDVVRLVDPEFGIVCYGSNSSGAAFACVKLPEPIVQKSAVRQ